MSSFLVGVLLMVSFVPAAQAQSETVCKRSLDAAEDQYLDGEYDEALRLVSACLNQDDLPQEQAVSAYRMLALIYLKQDQLERARSAVVNLLGIDPTYEADRVSSPPSYVSLVSIVQRELKGTQGSGGEIAEDGSAEQGRKPFFKRTSTWITMSSIVIGSGIATFFALEGGGGSGGGDPGASGPGSRPIPPGTPTGN